MKIYINLLMFVITFFEINGQVKLTNKQNGSDNLIYEIEIPNDYSQSELSKNNKLIFTNFTDESKPSEFVFPSYDLFIAIPQNSEPSITYNILSQKEIKGKPELNPIIEFQKDELIYKQSENPKIVNYDFFENLGQLWIDQNYCTHIKIHPYSISKTNFVNKIDKFKIKISFKNPLNINKVITSTKISPIILNQDFAQSVVADQKININNNDSWIDYSKLYVKIGVAKDAVYRIMRDELSSLGVSVTTINPKSFKMFLEGNEIPIYVNGETDLSFDEDDYIEFIGVKNMGGHHREVSEYGKPYNEYLGRYTDTTVYWLTWDGADGKRVNIYENGVLNSSDTLEYYSQIDHYEKNNWFDFSSSDLVRREMPFWTENKTWHEGNLGVGIRNKQFSVSDVFPDRQFKMFVKLQDYASDISNNSHLLTLSLNSTNIWSDSIYIDKYEQAVLQTEFNSNSLSDGANTLKINSIATNATINTCIFDWYEVEYPRYIKPIENFVNFSFPFLETTSERNIKIQNVTSVNFSIWKYGDGFKKYNTNKNNNEIVFGDTISSKDKFIYADETKILTPKIYYKKQFKDLTSSEHKADYIAITHKKFLEKTNEYISFIKEIYNIETITIDIEDIYDQFSFGFFNPEAVKDFLISTHLSWTSPYPKYVNMIGDATYDYHHNKETNFGLPRVNNYVPSFGAPVSDNWFIVWDTTGANIPQMNIGRLPVKEVEELNRYLQRHKTYVEHEYDDWNKSYLFFSGGKGDSQSELDLISSSNKYIINEYAKPSPIGGNTHHFYKTINPTTNFGPFEPSFVQETIDNGAVFISYIGHSGTRTWDNSITEPEHLNNKRNRSPLVTDYGCSTAKFAESDITSYSELFVLSEKSQGIAYIGNSSLGFTSTAVVFPKIFYKKILADSIYNISEALNQAKIELLQNFGSTEVNQLFVYTNTLIGDPIISLPIPQKTNLNVSSQNISIQNSSINDAEDSITCLISYNNFGSVPNDTAKIIISDMYNEQIFYQKELLRKIPNFIDSLLVKIPVKNKPGKHQLKISIDTENKIDEIYEDDNEAMYDIFVASSSTRTLLNYTYENSIDSSLIVLNPSTKPELEKLTYQISEKENFNQFKSFSIPLDTFYTKLLLNNLVKSKRYFIRTKLENETDFGIVKSFSKQIKSNFLLNDSLSFFGTKETNLNWKTNLILDTTSTVLSVSSAGFYDGRSALIFKNEKNYVPENFKTGHHIGLFNKLDYTFKEYKYFNTYSGGTSVINDYKTFLDSLSEDNLILIAISDDGRISDAELAARLRNIGSKYIDSLQFRSSWAIIGYKGAIQGSVPEAFSNPTEGPVKVDTSFSKLFSEGKFLTSQIGPSANWKNLVVQDSLPANSSITYKPILISQSDNSEDTLDALNIVNGEASLSFIDAKKYPYIKILAEFKAGENNTSPVLKSLGVDYTAIPELAINYQVVSVEKDTIQQGENANLQFYVYNVGESIADSVNVIVEVVNPDNSKEKIFETIIDSLGSEQRKKFNLSYPTSSFNGARTFSISIDSENKISELYEDNNYFNIPFYVIGDTTKPTLALTIDGNEIFDGEYVSNKPNIKIDLNDPSIVPITDTSSISVYLNNEYVSYFSNPEILKINYSSSNPKVTVEYNPILEDGEHTLKIFGKDASGNEDQTSGITKTFNVMNEAKLLEVYNYPNPFSSDTYFTFKLTQIPDEIKIRIFTVAGRLIKEINLSGTQLKYDMNKIYWDGKDEDGDLIGNGVYLYKVIMDVDGKKQDITQKLAVVR